MLSVEKIQKAIVPLAQKYGVDRVFLFGSYARGTATEKSDVDLRIDRGTLDGFRFGGFYVDVEETLNCKAHFCSMFKKKRCCYMTESSKDY